VSAPAVIWGRKSTDGWGHKERGATNWWGAVVCMDQFGIMGPAHEEIEWFRFFFIYFLTTHEWFYSQEKQLGLTEKYETFSGDRIWHLEQLLLLALCPKLNRFWMKIENQI
jgi:hypothetical protein